MPVEKIAKNSALPVRWSRKKKVAKPESLESLTKKLFSNPEKLQRIAAANTRKLTGKSCI